MSVIDEIAAERDRQINREGWTATHDDNEHRPGDLANAAACYAASGEHLPSVKRLLWPFGWNWWKPKTRRRDLIRAGALIVAEIERMDRQENRDE